MDWLSSSAKRHRGFPPREGPARGGHGGVPLHDLPLLVDQELLKVPRHVLLERDRLLLLLHERVERVGVVAVHLRLLHDRRHRPGQGGGASFHLFPVMAGTVLWLMKGTVFL